ncbi:MAG: ArnT family glycosyltransferase, partial [Myxococcota bacterium]
MVRIGAALPGWAWLLLGAGATAVFFVGATVHEVVRTPAFYASLSRGIAETGVWFPVMHLGMPYGLKPPLQLWLAAGNIAWLGPTALAVTFWPRLLGLLCAVLTADVGRRLYGNAAGFFAGLAMATNVTLI